MHSETKPRGRLAKRTFRTKLDAMRDKGVIEERTLTGYVCDECQVENPIGYRVLEDYKDQVEMHPANMIGAGVIFGILGIVLGFILLFIFFPIGILVLLAGLGLGVYSLIKGLLGLTQDGPVKVEGNIVVHEGDLACAICYGLPISVDTTRGQAILMRISSKQSP